MADLISKKVDILERCRQQAVDYAPTQWKEDHICWQAANEIDRLRAALVKAEAVMSIVEPRNDKAEYLAALDAVRAALTPETGSPQVDTAPLSKALGTTVEMVAVMERALREIDDFSIGSSIQPVQIARTALRKLFGESYRLNQEAPQKCARKDAAMTEHVHEFKPMTWQQAYPASAGAKCDCGEVRLGWLGCVPQLDDELPPSAGVKP